MMAATVQMGWREVTPAAAAVLPVVLARAEMLLQALAEPAMLALVGLAAQQEMQAVTAPNMALAMVLAAAAVASLLPGTARTAVYMGQAVAEQEAQAIKAEMAGRG